MQSVSGAKSAVGMESGFKGAASVFKNRRAIVVSGILLALHIILAMVLGIYLTQSVKFSISFITNVVTGYLFGPWMALVTGALGDILQYLLKPVGGYFFGWTFNAALGGLIYGLTFYRKAPKEEITKAPFNEEKTNFRAADFLSMGIFVVLLAVWFFLPFLDVTTKAGDFAEREILNAGTAFNYVSGAVSESVSTSPKTLAVATLVLILAGGIFALCKKRVFVILSGVVACLWLLLPMYNDRKILAARSGFILLCLGFAVCVLFNLFAVLRERAVDAKFLLRCFLAMLFVAVIVQMFLGTFWCVLMYGKGFWFYFASRSIKSMIQIPFNTVLVYYVIRALKQMRVEEIAR